MKHDSANFGAHVLGLLKNSGPSGPSGPTICKAFNTKGKIGTSDAQEVGPVDFEWSQPLQASGPNIIAEKQSVTGSVTTGTTGTTTFRQGPDAPESSGAPAEWHEILAELERQNCPDWLPPDRWNDALSDAEKFLSRWGSAAHSLGWTELDLFGVHSIAPAVRFDAMGLLLLIQGGAIVALTAEAATIRRGSGAVLSYRRSALRGAVLISKIQP
jgi:hypothetical protein